MLDVEGSIGGGPPRPRRLPSRNLTRFAPVGPLVAGSVLAELHDELDAYGRADLAPALVGKPGGLTPSHDKTPEQEEAEETLLECLVALNAARAAEEARGLVRWLRPEFQ